MMIKKIIFKVAQKMYFKGFVPWKVWSPICDRYHKLFEIDEKYV